MTISTTAGNATTWYCTEVEGPNLGYGTYVFHSKGRVDTLDTNMVAAVFTYQTDTEELDIEFSRWGASTAFKDLGYSVQTGMPQGSYNQLFQVTQSDATTELTEVITWAYHTALFQVYYGYQTWVISIAADTVGIWLNTSSWVPRSNRGELMVNFWLMSGLAPVTKKGAEWTITDFTFYKDDLTAGGYWAPKPAPLGNSKVGKHRP